MSTFLKSLGIAAAAVSMSSVFAYADVIGKVGVDWTGNDIVVEAIADPQVKGVTCHVTYFDRSLIA
jgi:CreA protein